jgi:hypothetical protein
MDRTYPTILIRKKSDAWLWYTTGFIPCGADRHSLNGEPGYMATRCTREQTEEYENNFRTKRRIVPIRRYQYEGNRMCGWGTRRVLFRAGRTDAA